jgi:hypothetical protein
MKLSASMLHLSVFVAIILATTYKVLEGDFDGSLLLVLDAGTARFSHVCPLCFVAGICRWLAGRLFH